MDVAWDSCELDKTYLVKLQRFECFGAQPAYTGPAAVYPGTGSAHLAHLPQTQWEVPGAFAGFSAPPRVDTFKHECMTFVVQRDEFCALDTARETQMPIVAERVYRCAMLPICDPSLTGPA